MQVTSQCRVDAPAEWVRRFLLTGTRDEDVSYDGDVIVIRQHDRLIDLVVRNTVTDEGDSTLLDLDAQLQLLGLARIVGTLFRGRVRRTLARSLDRLPTAIEQALEQESADAHDGDADGSPAA